MDENWLEISNENIDVEEIKQRVQARLMQRKKASPFSLDEDPIAVARDLWQDMIGHTTEGIDQDNTILPQPRDCDIVPRYYVIDWQNPILGPINALARRLINAEIRRFLLPSLEKQSSLNRRMLQALKDLAEENKRLRLEIEYLTENGSTEN